MSRNRSPARHRELDRNGGLVTEGRKLTMQAGQGARRSGIQVDRLYSSGTPPLEYNFVVCGAPGSKTERKNENRPTVAVWNV